MSEIEPEDVGHLERLVETRGLDGVLDALGVIAGEKAAYIRSAWQDSELANAWDDMAECVGVAHAQIVDKYGPIA